MQRNATGVHVVASRRELVQPECVQVFSTTFGRW